MVQILYIRDAFVTFLLYIFYIYCNLQYKKKKEHVQYTWKRFNFLSHALRKVSLHRLLSNGDDKNCSDIYLTLTASLIPYSHKSPAGKVYVGVLSVLQSIFTNCISESLPSLCFQT